MKRYRGDAGRARATAAAGNSCLALLLALGLSAGLSACSTRSPATIVTPYPAADGTSGSIPDSGIKLNNFLVVSAAKGAPGQLIGAVVNEGDQPVTVTMQAQLGASSPFAQTPIEVRAHGIAQVGPSGTEVTLPDTPVGPGALMEISGHSDAAGGVTLTVPVVPPSGYYSSYTVAPTPDATGAGESSPGDTSTQAPSGDSTAEPTST